MLALLDFDEFHDLLLDATRDLLFHIRREYVDKQIYAFYLVHDVLWGFIVPKLSVEGGIKPLPPFKPNVKRLVDRTFKPPPTPFSVLEIQDDGNGHINMKWVTKEPTDLVVARSIGREYFESVNLWLLRAQFYRVTFTDKQLAQYQRTLTAICEDVLEALDKRGLFGDGEAKVDLMMLKGSERKRI